LSKRVDDVLVLNPVFFLLSLVLLGLLCLVGVLLIPFLFIAFWGLLILG